jgi:hypothetical protein
MKSEAVFEAGGTSLRTSKHYRHAGEYSLRDRAEPVAKDLRKILALLCAGSDQSNILI